MQAMFSLRLILIYIKIVYCKLMTEKCICSLKFGLETEVNENEMLGTCMKQWYKILKRLTDCPM